LRFRDYAREPVALVLAAWGLLSLAYYAVVWLFFMDTDWGADSTYIVYDGSIVIATLVLFWVFRFYGLKSFEGKVWLVMAVGCTLWMVAELSWGLSVASYYFSPDAPWEGLRDAVDYIFLPGYALVTLAMVYKAKYAKLRADDAKAYAIACVVSIFAMVSVFLVLLPTLASPDLTQFNKFVNIAYVVMDLVLLGLGMAIALYWGSAVSKGWYIIAVAMLMMTIADIGYAALDWRGIYFDGNFIELFWIASYLLLALGAHYQKKLHESFM
jgi:hypothetical protein